MNLLVFFRKCLFLLFLGSVEIGIAQKSLILSVVPQNDSFVVMDTSGLIRTSLAYEQINEFNESRAVFRRGKFYGYLNESGQEIIAPTYELAYDFHAGLALVKQQSKYGYIDHLGATIIDF